MPAPHRLQRGDFLLLHLRLGAPDLLRPIAATQLLEFGLGAPTGVDQTSERPGVMPSPAWKQKALGQPWFPGETLSAGIGQGYVLMTPMQLAVMTATLANRGRHYRPHLLAEIDGAPVTPELLHTVDVPDPGSWDAMQAGMEHVVHSPRGTAKIIARDLGYRIAGKTGTAQVVGIAQNATYNSAALKKHQRDHALFIGFAPADDPQIAVAVIVENGEHGSSTAAPVARKVMDAYLLPRLPPPATSPGAGAASIARLEAEQRRAQRQLEQLAIEIRSEVRLARDRLIGSRALVETHEGTLLPKRREVLEQTLLHYNMMLLGVYDLLLARREETEAGQAATAARRDYWIARVRLERAVGGELADLAAPVVAPPGDGLPASTPEHTHPSTGGNR